MKAKELRQYLDKFLVSPAAQQARVQIELPNGEKLDLVEIQLLETRMIGDRDTHILNLKGNSLRYCVSCNFNGNIYSLIIDSSDSLLFILLENMNNCLNVFIKN